MYVCMYGASRNGQDALVAINVKIASHGDIGMENQLRIVEILMCH